MLTALEANFVQEFKVSGNATKALRNAGVDLPSASLKVKASRLLKRPDIKALIDNHNVNLVNELVKPAITIVNQKVINLPTKEEYASKALERSNDESTLKEDTKFKYYDLAGKVLGHIRNDSEEKSSGDTINIICRELRLVAKTPNNISDLSNSPAPIINIESHDACAPIEALKVVSASVVTTPSEMNDAPITAPTSTPVNPIA